MVSRRASRICIIGAGAGGLSTLKILRETEEYKLGLWELTVFERRGAIGGVWLQSPADGDPPDSPLYDALTTNLPHPVMAFQSHWFPPSTPLFPRASVVLTYLQSYAEKFDLLKHICFNTGIKECLWTDSSWEVQLSSGESRRFDRMIIANGHYGVPRYPTITGLPDWLVTGRASHSVSYRNSHIYKDMSILVVGNGPSGQDITAEVSIVAATVFHSFTGAPPEDVGNIRRRGRVIRFGASGTIIFEDGSAAESIDHVILATGYVMSFPFLPQLHQSYIPEVSPLPSQVLNTTYSVFPLARHIFPLQDDFPVDTVAFVGLLTRVAPFPLFEAQGRLIAKVFSQPGCLDRANESNRILARNETLRARHGNDPVSIARQWHILADSEQFSYRREILELAEARKQWDPEDWVEEIYSAKGELRKTWVALDRRGEAEDWVRGVGEGGRHEWVSLMRRLLQIKA